MRLSLADVIAGTGGELLTGPEAADPVLSSVTVDSRRVDRGALFVCLPGERADGHAFAAAAVAAGAEAVLGERDPFAPEPRPVPVICVHDAVLALGGLAALHRDRTASRVVGVTGTAGKTTVKEMLAQILAGEGRVSRNELNLNNRIGLPLSLLRASAEDRFWVMEAGISEPGDMDELGSILRPDAALVINAGFGHTAGLGDRGAAPHKAQLLRYVSAGGLCVVSADYPDLTREVRAVRPDVIFFSTADASVAYRAVYAGPDGETGGLYRLHLDGRNMEVRTSFRGTFGAENLIAAATAAHLLGVPAERIAERLSAVTLPRQRFCRKQVGNWLVIDDSYNANPLSSARMLEAAAATAAGRPLVCVLGEMLELGTLAVREHELLGRRAAEAGACAVFWKGGHGRDVARGLASAGFTGLFRSVVRGADLRDGLKECGLTGGVMLFKGSRGNRLEELAEAFVGSAEQCDAV